ncbi:MAG: ornithine carbamoyltransferase [Chloroflexi bacterium]|nr:ornithine carbamoyltransferase [Chloroflexota bacterium]MDA1148094.1 ornithine carbamoyltransferase [Chloroflexota bacterium]MQC83231.1 ornithine carbamoyltransferase [Chloroflexota bacterium]
MGRDLTSILDLSSEELAHVLDVSLGMKRDGAGPMLAGKTLALVFEKPSLRTRVSFEMAMQRLGGNAITLPAHEIQMGDREPVKDVARVLSRMVHGIAARTYAHETVLELVEYATVPVINALSEAEHPCQALADLLTLRERFGDLRGVRWTYVGDGNNIARSLAYASVMAGLHLTIATPPDFGLSTEDLARANALAGGGTVAQTTDAHAAVRDAAVVYTDVWASMGFEHELEDRKEHFQSYQLNAELLASAPPGTLVMHDLPAHRGEEISNDVIESERSIVFDQAENRMHAQQALLALLLADGPPQP